MSFSTDWNIEKYFDPTEYVDHWQLRKSFMETHKDKFPEPKLVALAKLFYNIEFLGCQYKTELMCLVNDMSKEVDVIVEHRENKKNKLKRTFVKASDAVKRKSDAANVNTAQASNKQMKLTDFVPGAPVNTNATSRNHTLIEPPKPRTTNKTLKQYEPNVRHTINGSDMNLLIRVRQQPGWKGKVVIFEEKLHSDKALSTIRISAVKAGLLMQMKHDREPANNPSSTLMKHSLLVGGDVVASYIINGSLTKKTRKMLADMALTEMRKYCFSIVINNRFEGERVARDLAKVKAGPALPADSIGGKIMTLMGWSGQGLGKNETGIQNPIEAVQVNRLGFGNKSNMLFASNMKREITKYLEKYISSQVTHSLIFSTEFSKEERKEIHQIAQRFNLKSRSYGKDSDRQLIVERKLTLWEILEDLLDAGGTTGTYTLVRPTHV